MRQSVPDSSSPIFRMSRDTAYPAASHDFEELVWENGTLLMRRQRDRVKSGDAMASWPSYGFLDDNHGGFEGNNKAGNETSPRLGTLHSMCVLDKGEASKPNIDNSQASQAPTFLLRSVSDSNHSLLSPNGFSKQPNSSRSLGGINKENFSHFLGLHHPQTNDPNIAKGNALLKPESKELAKMPSLEDKNMTSPQMTSPQKRLDQVEMLELDPKNEDVKVHSNSRFGGGDSLVPDEQSQAIGNHFIDDHNARDYTIDDDHLVPSPDTSLEDSNAVQRKLKRRRFKESESSYLDEDEGEEMEEGKRRSVHYSGGNAGTKRNRRPTHHNLSEKKRRERINKRIRALQVLLPNCNKLDKASVLDEAIEYMKTLQLQLQMLSTGARMLAPPMTMLPAGMHQMMPYLNQFSPGFAGMGMRMGPAFAQGLAHQFPIPGTVPANLAGGFHPLGCMPYINAHLRDHSALRSRLTGADFYNAGTSNTTTNNQLGSTVLSGSNETTNVTVSQKQVIGQDGR